MQLISARGGRVRVAVRGVGVGLRDGCRSSIGAAGLVLRGVARLFPSNAGRAK